MAWIIQFYIIYRSKWLIPAIASPLSSAYHFSMSKTSPLTPRPLAEASALDTAYYQDIAWFDFEREMILKPNWQVIAPASLVSEPGDTITRDIGGVPILIVRSATDTLNGFYNICPHRAGPLAVCDQRGLKKLRCSYHGWTYDLDGNLRIAPEMHEAKNFERNSIKLTPVECKEWKGLIWAHIGAGPNFSEIFKGIETDIQNQLDNLKHHQSRSYDVKSNWKIYVDNFLEGYHLPFVHPGLSKVIEYPNYRTELGEWWSLQRAPVLEESSAYGAGEGLYYFIYPNTMLNIMPGRLQTNRVLATGIDRCRIEFDFYYTDDAKSRAKEDDKFSDQVQEEDRLICEHVQRGLTSGAYKPGRLSPSQEAGVWHFQNRLRKDYARRT